MASKRNIRRRACEGKKRYASAAIARASVVSVSLRAYRCPHCKGYHNGHPIQRKRTRRAQFNP